MARLQLDLSDTSDALIERLRTLCDRSSKKDVVENALTLLAWAANEVFEGRKIAAVDESANVMRVIHMPAFDAAARHGEESRKAHADPSKD